MKLFPSILTVAVALLGTIPSTAQQLLNETVDVDGVQREYLLYVPASYDGTTAVPLMFTFHGGAMTPQAMLALADMRPLAEANTFLLIYPKGLPEKPGGSLIWNSEGPFTNGVDEMGFAEAMIDELAGNYQVDQSRVYACGYSNGGNLVWDLACILSDRFAAVAAVAGSMFQWTYDDCMPTNPTAALTIHGTADFTYNLYNGLATFTISQQLTTDYWAQVNGAETTPSLELIGNSTEHYTWAEQQACFSVEHYKVLGGGHDWPGAFGSSDFDANEVIWDYVSQFDLNGLISCSPTTYCTAKASSAGCLAQISASSTMQPTSGASGYQVEASGVHSFKSGLLFASLSGAANLPFNGGTLCMNPPLKRGPIITSGGTGANTCTGSYSTEVNDGQVIPNGLDAGSGNSAWYQYWYRDPMNGSGQLGTALSNAVELSFQ